MGYAEKNLMPGETILYRAALHWARFLGPAFWLVVGILFMALGLRDSDLAVLFFLGPFIALFGIIAGAVAFLQQLAHEFVLTDRRLILKHGVLRRTTLEPLLHKLETVGVDQSILGRILGYGEIQVSGTGGSLTEFPYISSPLAFRKAIYEQVEAVQEGRN